MNDYLNDPRNWNGQNPDESGIPHVELETKPTEAGQQAATEALEVIHGRSFSGRHPELGKMIKCQTCGRRHRTVQELRTHGEDGIAKQSKLIGTVTCELQYATGRYDLRDPKPLLIAGKTPETSSLRGVTARSVLGATYFAKRRIKPHSNRWKSARENHLAAKQLELKKRLAKPLDVWENDGNKQTNAN